MTKTETMATKTPSRVAVIGCGWWAQGWHLPHLAANAPHVVIAAIVDASPLPISTLSSSPLLSLVDLSKKYNCPHYNSVEEMLADPEVGPTLDGVVVATSHASHFQVGMALLKEGVRRRSIAEAVEKEEQVGSNSVTPQSVHRAMHILMEKPMTCSVAEALEMSKMSMAYPEGAFVINHTASYRPQTFVAKNVIASGQLGRIRHITATMNGGLMWLFDNQKNESWTSKTPWQKEENTSHDNKTPMNGNGYAWGQLAHILAWIYAVLGADNDVALPKKVFCTMTHAPNTGADISLAAVITCSDGITFSISGTALLPGSQYADPPIGKRINVEIFGMDGCMLWGGDDRIPESGKLELRRSAPGEKRDGQSEFPCSQGETTGNELKDGFYFEDGSQDGKGPGSLEVFLDACESSAAKCNQCEESTSTLVEESEPILFANDSLIGLRTVQIIDAMYKSSISGNAVDVQ